MSMTTTPPSRSLPALASGVLLFASLGSLGGGVDGLATKTTYYNDFACEVVYGSSSLIFGFPDLDSSEELREFQEGEKVYALDLSFMKLYIYI